MNKKEQIIDILNLLAINGYFTDEVVEDILDLFNISDEEIEKGADYYSFAEDSSAYVDFIEGAKWYREQLKKK